MTEETVNREAVHWLDALKRDDADWDGFTRWLEADPAHREAYDSAALIDGLIETHRPALASLVDIAPARARAWPLWAGGSAAVAATVALGLMLVGPADQAARVFRTGTGPAKLVALADGTRVELAPATMLTVKDGGATLAVEGTASFVVPHRPDRSLSVEAGGLSVQDIGTTFEVATGGPVVRVQVAEGQVSVAAPELAAPVKVESGKKLVVDRSTGTAELRPAGEYGTWRRGRLVYDDAPLALVAAEVGRYAGRRVVLAPDLAARRFSGVLTIGDGSRLVGDLARLMDVDAHENDAVVRLASRSAR